MANKRDDRPEFSFRPAHRVAGAATRAAPDHRDSDEDYLARQKQACGNFESAGLHKAILDAMIL